MKKKLFRERRYAKNVLNVETFEKHIENPELEVKRTKKRVSKKKEA